MFRLAALAASQPNPATLSRSFLAACSGDGGEGGREEWGEEEIRPAAARGDMEAGMSSGGEGRH